MKVVKELLVLKGDLMVGVKAIVLGFLTNYKFSDDDSFGSIVSDVQMSIFGIEEESFNEVIRESSL